MLRAIVTNAVTALGDWDPVDGRDDASADNVAAGPVEDGFTARAVATQKSVRNLTDSVNSPGDLLEYTIDVQVSDHLAVDDLVVEDVLSDGQRLDPTFDPSMAVSGASSSATAAMTQVDVTDRWTGAPAPVAPLDGTTRLELRISDELADRGLDPILQGGCVPPGGTGGPAVDCDVDDAGATTVQIVFRTVIQAEFSDDTPDGRRLGRPGRPARQHDHGQGRAPRRGRPCAHRWCPHRHQQRRNRDRRGWLHQGAVSRQRRGTRRSGHDRAG